MKKRTIIIKEPDTKLTLASTYIEIKSINQDLIIALKHIDSIYINKSIDLSISTCYELSTKVSLFIIDEHGYILAKFQRLNDA